MNMQESRGSIMLTFNGVDGISPLHLGVACAVYDDPPGGREYPIARSSATLAGGGSGHRGVTNACARIRPLEYARPEGLGAGVIHITYLFDPDFRSNSFVCIVMKGMKECRKMAFFVP